jgi:hypothetical protein
MCIFSTIPQNVQKKTLSIFFWKKGHFNLSLSLLALLVFSGQTVSQTFLQSWNGIGKKEEELPNFLQLLVEGLKIHPFSVQLAGMTKGKDLSKTFSVHSVLQVFLCKLLKIETASFSAMYLCSIDCKIGKPLKEASLTSDCAMPHKTHKLCPNPYFV